VQFHVLLGPDQAGKSTALTALRARAPRVRVLSVDNRFLSPGHELIGRLRGHLMTDVLPGLGTAYSTDFLAALLQTAVLHLRDQLATADGTGPVLLDSYYYKILAKCRLAGVDDNNPMLSWWRTFPQPVGVFYLDVPPETAWLRGSTGSGPNPLEYHGDQPTREGFVSYQEQLGKLMLDEVSGLPVRVIDGTGPVVDTVRILREELADDRR